MISLLLALIYLSYVSLGLPDSLLGSAWPVMQNELQLPLSAAGIVTMLISGCTIISSLTSARVIRRFGTGTVNAISVTLTACGLFGFSLSGNFLSLCLFTIPYGLGAGAVDAAMNNYVALHFSSRHMSWLHAFWGLGVTISPYIMSFCLSGDGGWKTGYSTVAIIQSILAFILFLTLPVWKKARIQQNIPEEEAAKVLTFSAALRLKGVPYVLIAFFAYCAMEATAGLWATSYLVGFRGVVPETAARFAALFYIGITAGRFLSGLIADRFGDRIMIRTGILILMGGIILVALPVSSPLPALIGLVVIGLGSAPIYPSVIHSTPTSFGAENSQSLVGIQMASAYVGSTFLPPVFGLLAQYVHIGLYPFFLGFFAVLMLLMTELLQKAVARK